MPESLQIQLPAGKKSQPAHAGFQCSDGAAFYFLMGAGLACYQCCHFADIVGKRSLIPKYGSRVAIRLARL